MANYQAGDRVIISTGSLANTVVTVVHEYPAGNHIYCAVPGAVSHRIVHKCYVVPMIDSPDM